MIATDLGAICNGYRHALSGSAPGNTADGHFAQVIICFQRGHHDLQTAVGIHVGAGAVLQDCIKEGSQVLAFIVHMELGNAVSGRAVNEREIELFIIRFQFDKQVQDFAFHIGNALVRTVDFIDDDDWFQLMFQCLAENVLRLGHWAFMGIYQQENAIYHVEDTFYFAAEICMPWGINDIDFHAVVHDRGIFCQNGNASFPFNRVGVHDTFCHFLVISENMALFQHGIHKSRLAMVDMGDNGNVTDIFSFHFFFFPPRVYSKKQCISVIIAQRKGIVYSIGKYGLL